MSNCCGGSCKQRDKDHGKKSLPDANLRAKFKKVLGFSVKPAPVENKADEENPRKHENCCS